MIVHSYSRFSRDAVEAGVHLKRLKRLGIRLVSVTQPTAEDATGEMTRQNLLAFNAYQSNENVKHTLRAMKENPREGYWNGSPPPHGYLVEEAGRRGDKTKKRLAVDEAEAAVVREVVELCLQGRAGIPLGVKAIAKDWNERGIRFRGGCQFSTGLVHRILTNATHGGSYTFKRVSAETEEAKPQAETVSYPFPVIVSPETLAQVRQHLASRAPARTPPRVVSGPILLTGLAICSTCGGGMTLRTGTSKTGVVYRYYACSAAARKGRTACPGRSIPMAELDGVVEGGLFDRVFRPERLAELVAVVNEPAVDAGGAERETQPAARGAGGRGDGPEAPSRRGAGRHPRPLGADLTLPHRRAAGQARHAGDRTGSARSPAGGGQGLDAGCPRSGAPCLPDAPETAGCRPDTPAQTCPDVRRQGGGRRSSSKARLRR
jgi:DNA invertase Pin-like site-specific DNA recombinase